VSGICEGRVVVVTGAGRGIGREEALEFARQGAKVVVNDLVSGDEDPAQDVVGEIVALGAEAVASHDSVADWDAAGRIVRTALDSFGGLDVVVNNAGILRDRMLVNMSVQEWDDVMAVHLRGTFCVTRHAVDHWRAESKAGRPVDARVINTSSPSGIYGNVGQANYGAAKAGLAAFTVIAADELGRYGVTVNAIAPSALTRMTQGLPEFVATVEQSKTETGFDIGSPSNIAPLVVWLGSEESREITGRVFNVRGAMVGVAEPWVAGPYADKVTSRWDPAELGAVVPDLVHRARRSSDMRGTTRPA
jgi:NAD(P)-dependent dehydrogenase (short-subunit alcohol dehydrogenase family)